MAIDEGFVMYRRKLIWILFAIALAVSLSIVSMPKAHATTTSISDTRTESFVAVNAGDTYIIEPSGSLTLHGEMKNFGTIIVRGQLIADYGTSTIENYGQILVVAPGGLFVAENNPVADNNAIGGLLTNYQGAIIHVDAGAVATLEHFTNEGTITNYGTLRVMSGYVSGAGNNNPTGTINNYAGEFDITAGWPGESSAVLTNRGNINNNSVLLNGLEGTSNPMLVISQGGDSSKPRAILDNFGTVRNQPGFGGITISGGAAFNQECNAVFINSETSPQPTNVCQQYPLVHMQDTTATAGSVTYAGRQINSEYVNSTSQLIGDKIDSITLRLQKIGAPPGTFQVGIFNADLTPKKSFEIRSTSTLSTAFQDYEFKLPNNELYTIQNGDRIGIKYNGGDASNAISVMTDRDAADPFDGNKSYRARYETSWIVSYGEDMYMTLKQTHADGQVYPIVHMSDTTASFASLVSAPRQLMSEYVTPSSQLVGDKIDSITLKLQKVGAPTGTAQVGIFNFDLTPKTVFATIDVSTISSTATDYEFKLPAASPLYTIASGDRIGIKYTGGSSTVGINVTPDRDTADPFDGANSYRMRYEAAWTASTGEDMYMILKQTHA